MIDTGAPDTTIDDGPSAATNDATPTFTFSSEAGATFRCRIDGAPFATCASPFTATALADGPHTFEVQATDANLNVDGTPASRAFTVDTAPPPAPDVSGPQGPTTNASPQFNFNAAEATATECRLDGPTPRVGEFGPCTSPKGFGSLAPGDYVFFVRSTDAAGNTQITQRAFTVTLPQQATPTPTPSATPTPTPGPVENQSVGARPVSGTVLVRLPGSKVFVGLVPSVVKNGAEFDTRNGVVEITRADGGVARFYAGIFKLSQSGGYTVLTLTREADGLPEGQEVLRERGRQEAQDAQVVGRRQGQVQDQGPVLGGHRARHQVARPGHLHHDADARRAGRGRGQRLRQEEEGPDQEGQALHRSPEEEVAQASGTPAPRRRAMNRSGRRRQLALADAQHALPSASSSA